MTKKDLYDPQRITTNSTVYHSIAGKRVAVTGGGGSIGSELVRQLAACSPERIIITDICENGVYELQDEMKSSYPGLKLDVRIASIRDFARMLELFMEFRPEIVFHAAAHKHVPLMEDPPCEAIKNNVAGTYNTAAAAMASGCERFVLISSDKAVEPVSVMGVSKRMCEMMIQSFDALVKSGRTSEIPMLTDEQCESGKLKTAKTEFVAVRFGNVLESSGSVIPLFRRQIHRGGPVTVTHPDAMRYFMTITEAVSLVLLAGADAKGGEIFVLDMGSPVKIDDIARKLITDCGLEPDVDIKIEYTGLRRGDKLSEKTLMDEEGLRKTANDRIWVCSPVSFDCIGFLHKIVDLTGAACHNSVNIKELCHEIIPAYKPQ